MSEEGALRAAQSLTTAHRAHNRLGTSVGSFRGELRVDMPVKKFTCAQLLGLESVRKDAKLPRARYKGTCARIAGTSTGRLKPGRTGNLVGACANDAKIDWGDLQDRPDWFETMCSVCFAAFKLQTYDYKSEGSVRAARKRMRSLQACTRLEDFHNLYRAASTREASGHTSSSIPKFQISASVAAPTKRPVATSPIGQRPAKQKKLDHQAAATLATLQQTQGGCHTQPTVHASAPQLAASAKTSQQVPTQLLAQEDTTVERQTPRFTEDESRGTQIESRCTQPDFQKTLPVAAVASVLSIKSQEKRSEPGATRQLEAGTVAPNHQPCVTNSEKATIETFPHGTVLRCTDCTHGTHLFNAIAGEATMLCPRDCGRKFEARYLTVQEMAETQRQLVSERELMQSAFAQALKSQRRENEKLQQQLHLLHQKRGDEIIDSGHVEHSVPASSISNEQHGLKSVQHHKFAEKECRQLYAYFQQTWKPGNQMYVNSNLYPGFSRYNKIQADAATRVRHQKFHTVLLTSEDDTTAETPGLYSRFKEDLPRKATENWEALEREVLKVAAARRGDHHSDSVHSYSDLDGSYTGSAISFLSGNWHRSCAATDGNTLKVTFFCTRDRILCGHFLKQDSKAVAHFRWHIDNDREEDEHGNVYSNEGHWDAVVTVVVVLGNEGTPSGIAFQATQPEPDPAEEELERLERSDPGDMDITQLQALYEHLIGRVATGAWGKDESGLRLKIAEAHRKHLLFCCYPNFMDECVDVALKSQGAKGVEIKENGVTVALATVVENRLLCICVRDDFQKSRYGTFLLSKCCTLIPGDEMVVEADLVFEEWYRQRGFERAGSKATETYVLMRAGKRALLDACKQLTTRRRRPRIESF
eukprot:COSAG02_NODE_3880_length_6093_cov_33.940274_3_plen_873_part_00